MKNILVGITVVGALFVFPHTIQAQNEQSESVWDAISENFQPIEQTYGGLPTDPRAIVALIIKIILSILGIIYIAMIVYGGLLWMTAKGNTEQVAKAKSTILHGTIGVGIIIAAFAIARLIVTALGCAVQRSGDLCLFMNNLTF